MSAPARKTISVDLGPLVEKAEARVKSGAYASISDVLREGLRALEREEEAFDRLLPPIDESDPEWQADVRAKVREALDDPRPPIPADEVFLRLYTHIEERRRKSDAA